MQKILKKENSVYLICKQNKCSSQEDVAGVFCYTEGEVFLPCLPFENKEIIDVLKKFYLKHNIFCVSGKESYALIIINIIDFYAKQKLNEKRNLYFMEYDPQDNVYNFSFNSAYNIFRCKQQDVTALMPLHLSYMSEEVLPKGSTLYPASERLSVEDAVKNQIVFALEEVCKEKRIVIAKAQTNAISTCYMQIGGVFTKKSYRGKGFASCLVKSLAEFGLTQNKQSVLYVNKKNTHAINCYKKAGFNITEKYIIAYYNDKE